MNFKNKILFFLIGLVLLISISSSAQQIDNREEFVIDNEFIVWLNHGEDVNILLKSINAESKSTAPIIQVKENLSSDLNIYLFKSNMDIAAQNNLLKKMRSNRSVAFAQYNHEITQRNAPNDSLFSQQWSLNNTGQSGGTADADIDAIEAWDISTGGILANGDTAVLAVIDGGCFYNHKELSMWYNRKDTIANNTDDDGNGYIDDFYGWNATGQSEDISTGDAHGTGVCGVVAAKGNNTSGLAGVNWNAKVMFVQGSTLQEVVAVRAYTYVWKQRYLYNTTNGAKGAFVLVTNSSFGVDKGQPANYPIWCAMYDTMGAQGILSAAATANQNYNVDTQGDIPTACNSNYLITVTNSNSKDLKHTAGYGKTTIDLAAPGVGIKTISTNNGYTSQTGTSFSSPHVAGAVGLMYSAASLSVLNKYKANPDSMALEFKNWLLCSTDWLDTLSEYCLTSGRLNLHSALQKVQAEQGCTVNVGMEKIRLNSFNTDFRLYPNPTANYVEVSYKLNSDSKFEIEILDASGRIIKSFTKNSYEGMHTHTINTAELKPGVYFVRLSNQNGTSNYQKLVKE